GGSFNLNGTISGSGSLTLAAGTAGTWGGGGLTTSGTRTVQPGGTVTLAAQLNTRTFSAGVLSNAGTVNFTQDIVTAVSGQVRNTGTWNIGSGRGATWNDASSVSNPFTFLNSG